MNKSYFGYIRVSTVRQGERGVSLPEQREAIERFAARQGFTINRWFEEQQTAAKRGRPIWSEMLKLLRQGRAGGVIIHKIDRSARNLKDWADLGELIDQGIDVQFANESLDLLSRGGRLSADIQAVVAADYIRNLREEAKKGFYGRLRRGFYPMRAPLGYLDNGAGKSKTIDPVKGRLVRKAFELYASEQYSIPVLVGEMHRRGLRNVVGSKVTDNGLWNILKNPFYVGVIRIYRTKETFEGNHEPLVSRQLFDTVQDVMHGRLSTRTKVHDFLFRKFIRCTSCKQNLIGELQKGRVYYRCHQKECPVTSIREDVVQAAVSEKLERLTLNEEERAYFTRRIAKLKTSWANEKDVQKQRLAMKLQQVAERLKRLTDAYLDQSIEKDLFEERKIALLFERKETSQSITALESNQRSVPDELEKFIELASSAYSLYEMAGTQRKRQLLKTLTSNCSITEKRLEFAFAIPFSELANREVSSDGRPSKGLDRTLGMLVAHFLNSTVPSRS